MCEGMNKAQTYNTPFAAKLRCNFVYLASEMPMFTPSEASLSTKMQANAMLPYDWPFQISPPN